MAYYTANHIIPDLNYEYRTVTVDTIGHTSANNITVNLTTPLQNVVQAKLLACHIHTKATNKHINISIAELEVTPNLNERVGISPISNVSGVFATMVSDAISHGNDDYVHLFKNEYPIISQYLTALQNISTLTIKIYGPDGKLITPDSGSEPNHLILSFVCRRQR
tara:strand:- start:139 stop:633 length:495 start_codon:yes stop_codon:yes gene_type:complete